MRNRWSAKEAENFAAEARGTCSQEVASLIYASRLLGAEHGLVLHGGGNTSVKDEREDLFGRAQPALTIKGSGRDMARALPADFATLGLSPLQQLRQLSQLTETGMANELCRNRLNCSGPSPSIETLAHAFLPAKYVLHTHADAVLVLTNQEGGAEVTKAALGDDVILVPYHRPGFSLAKAAAAAYDAAPLSRAMVWLQHGIVTWGASAEEAYTRMIELVSRAEAYAEKKSRSPRSVAVSVTVEDAGGQLEQIAPVLRGILLRACADANQAPGKAIVVPLVSPEVLAILGGERAQELLVSPPLTSDHLIRTKPLPLWFELPEPADSAAVAASLRQAIDTYGQNYRAYVERNGKGKIPADDGFPRLIMIPGVGVLAAGCDIDSANIARDIARQSILAKDRIAAIGGAYQAPPEIDLFHMEYDPFQRAKLAAKQKLEMAGRTALVTGAAGAIGMGICEELLRAGCAVALGDLPGERLTSAAQSLAASHRNQVLAVPFDVTDPQQVAGGFREIARAWGGLDLLVINAGIAHAAFLADLDLEAFRRLEKVNVEGTLNLLSESARHFRLQNAGGDIVLISTKNVFAPGAGFGAYSATKAAAHQLARIASLEMASMGVRVNMVAPDAVFSHGAQRSGLWETVGPERMKARGLDEKGLESYYQSRNLLKARIDATHVANAVIFFATRQTPTTGATIPVDGGLPDATPR